MSNYVKATNFAVKDTLSTGDTNKVVRGTEIDTEFTAIASAIASKADTASPSFTGTPTAPTASTATENTQIATTAYVASKIGAIAAGVTSFSAGSTGLTPSTSSSGAVTLAGTLAVASGGTGATTTAAARTNLNVPTRTGGDASGTWGIDITGNAATATTATTATTADSASSVSSSVVGSATAGLSLGAVGTYAFLKSITNTTFNPGATTSGSNLRYAGMVGAGDSSLTGTATSYWATGTPSGTWRCMGYSRYIATSGEDDGFNGLTLWLRIS